MFNTVEIGEAHKSLSTALFQDLKRNRYHCPWIFVCVDANFGPSRRQASGQQVVPFWKAKKILPSSGGKNGR
jgi:hypothetical protein